MLEEGLESTVEDIKSVENDGRGANRKRFDFRYKKMPDGISFHAHDAIASKEIVELHKMEEPSDSASYVSLRSCAFMKVDLTCLNSKKHFESWTITMDMKIDSLPEAGQALLQCSADESKLRQTVETEIYPMGSVGIFEEIADIKTWLKPGKWNRVTIRFGGTPRTLTTFLNGIKSISVHKPVFDTASGRFAIPAGGLLLFAAQDPRKMPGVHIRSETRPTTRCLRFT
jgi:hypothetical protein